MKAGDLVGHIFEDGLGLILETPEQTNKGLYSQIKTGLYLVHFTNSNKPRYYRERLLEVIK